MRYARRCSRRAVSSLSLLVCLSLVLTSLAIVPVSADMASKAERQDRKTDSGNDKARKVKPGPSKTGAPAFELPNLDQAKRTRRRDPEAPPPQPSTVRSKRKPLESRGGKRVGDPGTAVGFTHSRRTIGKASRW